MVDCDQMEWEIIFEECKSLRMEILGNMLEGTPQKGSIAGLRPIKRFVPGMNDQSNLT